MSEFINTLDLSSDEVVLTSIIDRSIGEYKDRLLTNIGDYAFYDCKNLEVIDLPAITDLGDYVFFNCTNLKSINLPSATTIGGYAFYDCKGLESVNLPLATSIGSYAFTGCTSLESIDLASATSIGTNALVGCTKLTTLILRSNTVATIDSRTAFDRTPMKDGTGYVYVPDELVETYKITGNWRAIPDQIKPLSELGE